MALGPGALSDAEILALVLRTGTGQRDVLSLATMLLIERGGVRGLARATFGELAHVHGIGPAKAAEIAAALELGRRASRQETAGRPQIRGASDVAALLFPRLAHLDHEESVVLLLDRRHRILREMCIGVGGVAQSPMEPREIFAAALREPGTAAIVVAHNHPSGEATASQDDIAITRRLVHGASLLGVELVDHVIVAAGGWVSLRESGVFT
jgi:DNA repair protein RadC